MERHKVLIIDDEIEVLDDLSLFLRQHYDIALATSSHEGWAQFRTAPPDIVLLDLNMPNHFANDSCYEGFALLRKIRSCSDVPVIVVSDQEPTESAKQASHLGATAFFAKPCDVNILMGQIDEAIDCMSSDKNGM